MAKLIQIGATVTPGERRMLACLERELSADTVVIGNPLINLGSTTRELDAIVVKPDGRLFVIETKDLHGKITGDEDSWLVGGRRLSGVVNKSIHNAAVLKGKIVKKFPRFLKLRADALIILTSDDVDLAVADERVSNMTIKLSSASRFFGKNGGRKLPEKDLHDIVRGIVGDVAFDEILPGLNLTETKDLKPIAADNKATRDDVTCVRITGPNGFVRTYFENQLIGRNELRGVPNWDRLSGLQIMLHIRPGLVELSQLSGKVSVDSSVLEKGRKIQVNNRWFLNLADAGIQLIGETIRQRSNCLYAIGA
jgi:hypothetical protein